MNAALFVKEIKGSLPAFAAITAVLALYVVSIAYMYDPQIVSSLDSIMASMPGLFAAFGMANLATDMTSFMLNYLYGFLLTWMPLLLVMMLVNRMVVRPIDRGTMANLLATPVSRLRIAGTFSVALLCMLVAQMVLVIGIEVLSAEALFPGELDVPRLVRASAGLLGLWVFMGGVCFASGCCLRDARAALWVGGGLCLVMLLLQVLAQAGDGLAVLRDLDPVAWYDPFRTAAGETDAVMACVVLAGAGLALLAAGVAAFCRRDLNV